MLPFVAYFFHKTLAKTEIIMYNIFCMGMFTIKKKTKKNT